MSTAKTIIGMPPVPDKFSINLPPKIHTNINNKGIPISGLLVYLQTFFLPF